MENEIIDGVSYKVGSPEWVAAKNKFLTKITSERDAALGRADSAEKVAEKAKKDLAGATVDPKVFQERVNTRVRLITDCRRAAETAKHKFDEEAAAATDDQTLILEAIKLLDPSFNAANKSPEYLAGYFASLVKSLGPATVDATVVTPGVTKTDDKKTIFSAREGVKEPNAAREDAADDPDKARADMVKRNREAWKKPLRPHA